MRVNGARCTSDGTVEDAIVAAGVKEDAVGHLPVSAGPAWLPVVVFHGLGQKGVDHVAHVRLVDAHAKGYGGTDDLPIISVKSFSRPKPLSPKPLTAYFRTEVDRYLTLQKVMNLILYYSNCMHPWARCLTCTNTITTLRVEVDRTFLCNPIAPNHPHYFFFYIKER